MGTSPNFSDVVEAVDNLSLEEQETLLELVHGRLMERRRERLAAAVAAAREEYAGGAFRAATVDDLMAEIRE